MKRFKKKFLNVISILITIIYSFPVFYMILTSFKAENDIVPPKILFNPTLQNYKDVIDPNFLLYVNNSLIIVISTVLLSLLLALPAAYVIAFTNRKNIFFWFVTTILLPPVGIIVPVYIIFNKLSLLDTKFSLILLYLGTGIPLMVWLVTTFLKDIPIEIIEAADVDGSSRINSFFKIILPLAKTGIISSALLVFIFVWNEFFFAMSLTYSNAPTLPVYTSKYMTQQGYFWGKMSAVSTIVIIIPVIVGILSQQTFIKGLTMGAVKQ